MFGRRQHLTYFCRYYSRFNRNLFMIYIAFLGLFLVAGLVAILLLTGEGKHYGRQGDSNYPGDLML